MSASQNTSTPATAAEQSEDVVTLISELESHAVWVPPQPAAVMRRVAAYLAKPSDEAKLINIALGLMNSPKGANLVQEVAKLIATPVVQGHSAFARNTFTFSEAPLCKRCGDTGVVDDGEIDEGFENGPIQCVKDCPACATPVVQGETRKIGRIIINELGYPFAALYTSFDEAGEVWKDGAPLYATPAPSPKEPSDLLCICGTFWEPNGAGWKMVQGPHAGDLVVTDRDKLIVELEAQATWVPSGPAAVMRRAAAALATRGPIGAVEPTDEQIYQCYLTMTAQSPIKFARAILALSRTPGAGNAD